MRSKKRIEVIVLELTLQRQEPNFLQNNIAIRVSEHFFLDLVAPLDRCIRQAVQRNSRLPRTDLEAAIPLLFRKELLPIGNKEFLITCAGLVHSREVNLIQNAVAQCEPDTALRRQRGTHSALGARSPTRRDSGPTRSRSFQPVAHVDLPFRCDSFPMAP